MIENYFSVPIYFSHVDKFESANKQILSCIDKIKLENFWQRDNDTAKTSYNLELETNVILNYKMIEIENVVLEESRKYIDQTNNDLIPNSISIENSWINLFDKENSIGWHDHGYQPNTLSGVYYVEAPYDCAKILFKNPNPYGISFPHRSDIYSNIISCTVHTGLLILFPSWLMHKVEPNRIDQKRISLAFNISFTYK